VEIDTINRRAYSSPKIARSYTHTADLTDAERARFHLFILPLLILGSAGVSAEET
jgi:hypothetical protein